MRRFALTSRASGKSTAMRRLSSQHIQVNASERRFVRRYRPYLFEAKARESAGVVEARRFAFEHRRIGVSIRHERDHAANILIYDMRLKKGVSQIGMTVYDRIENFLVFDRRGLQPVNLFEEQTSVRRGAIAHGHREFDEAGIVTGFVNAVVKSFIG